MFGNLFLFFLHCVSEKEKYWLIYLIFKSTNICTVLILVCQYEAVHLSPVICYRWDLYLKNTNKTNACSSCFSLNYMCNISHKLFSFLYFHSFPIFGFLLSSVLTLLYFLFLQILMQTTSSGLSLAATVEDSLSIPAQVRFLFTPWFLYIHNIGLLNTNWIFVLWFITDSGPGNFFFQFG